MTPDRALILASRAWAGAAVLSLSLLLFVGSLGPSAAVVPLSPEPSRLAGGWTVSVAMWCAAAAGWLAVAAGLAALRRGWRPPPGRLLAAGLVACGGVLVVPPLSNGDIGSYAAYGRAAVLGESPYATVPSDFPGDVIAAAAEDPWRDQASVYGPVASATHFLAARIGQDSLELVLRLLAATSAAAFAGTALILHRLAADKARAHVLWTCNPLLILHLVAGAHVDVLVCLFLALAVAARRSWPLTGAALGLALCVKVTAGISVIGLVAARRHRALPALAVAGSLTALLYALAGGRQALQPLLEARSRVSGGTPWRWIVSALEKALPDELARTAVSVGVAVLAVALLRVLLRELPSAEQFVRLGAALWLAYLFAAGYQLAWYDSVGYLYLALLTATRWDNLLTAHTAVLTLAYLPGRLVPMPDSLEMFLPILRSGICPAAILVLWVVAFRRSPWAVTAAVTCRVRRTAPVEGQSRH